MMGVDPGEDEVDLPLCFPVIVLFVMLRDISWPLLFFEKRPCGNILDVHCAYPANSVIVNGIQSGKTVATTDG
jgi:hypothetical protein